MLIGLRVCNRISETCWNEISLEIHNAPKLICILFMFVCSLSLSVEWFYEFPSSFVCGFIEQIKWDYLNNINKSIDTLTSVHHFARMWWSESQYRLIQWLIWKIYTRPSFMFIVQFHRETFQFQFFFFLIFHISIGTKVKMKLSTEKARKKERNKNVRTFNMEPISAT